MGKKRAAGDAAEPDELEFEDEFEDEFEEEDEDEKEDIDSEDVKQADDDNSDAEGDPKPDAPESSSTKVWRAGVDTLQEGEVLEFEPGAYAMYHALQLDWPCLSFDVVRDDLGLQRTRFPMTMFLVAGTQADKASSNKVVVMKLTQLHRIRPEDSDEEEEEDDDSSADEDAVLEHKDIRHIGSVNRIRVMRQDSGIAATWSDKGAVHVWDIRPQLYKLQGRPPPRTLADTKDPKPVFTFDGHSTEGFALDWSPVVPARLATGDCSGSIFVWDATGVASSSTWSWRVDGVPYTAHTDSVEDIQWSPSEQDVFASSSVDRTLRIWDTRNKAAAALTVSAHTSHVNVISWNSLVTYLLASGSDNGNFRIWDLRKFTTEAVVAEFNHHAQAITSIEWNPADSSSLAVSSADNQVTVWDMSVEKDIDADGAAADDEYAPQLMFIHQGQTDVKEVHWHPQLPAVLISTAADGFNVFKPSNL